MFTCVTTSHQYAFSFDIQKLFLCLHVNIVGRIDKPHHHYEWPVVIQRHKVQEYQPQSESMVSIGHLGLNFTYAVYWLKLFLIYSKIMLLNNITFSLHLNKNKYNL